MGRRSINWFQDVIESGDARVTDLPAHISQGRPLRPIVPGLFSVAPMIDKTNRHFRWFLRLLTKKAVLYTEMVTSAAIIHGKRSGLLDFDQVEHPIVLQLGGDDPEEIAESVRIAEDWGYDEYNLNVGCPSDRVQKGSFGACLMADPHRVADIVAAIAAVSNKPVTVKHRVGIDGFGYKRESFEEMVDFIRVVASSGCERFIVHARMAILEGLSPKENRVVPPLRYADVHRLKTLYPNLHIEINGHVHNLKDAAEHLVTGMDGIMFGRASYEDPWLMAQLDGFEDLWQTLDTDSRKQWLQNESVSFAQVNKRDVILAWADYMDEQVALGANPRSLVWPILELFPSVPGSRKYKQILSNPYRPGVNMATLVREALSQLPIDLQGEKPL